MAMRSRTAQMEKETDCMLSVDTMPQVLSSGFDSKGELTLRGVSTSGIRSLGTSSMVCRRIILVYQGILAHQVDLGEDLD